MKPPSYCCQKCGELICWLGRFMPFHKCKEKSTLTPEQKTYYDKEVAKIRRGGPKHTAWMQDYIWGMGSKNLGPLTPPVVNFGQDDDPHYTQYLQNWDEVEALIAELREEATKAWGGKS